MATRFRIQAPIEGPSRVGEALTNWSRAHSVRINCWLLGAALGGSAAILIRAAWTYAVWAAAALGIG